MMGRAQMCWQLCEKLLSLISIKFSLSVRKCFGGQGLFLFIDIIENPNKLRELTTEKRL